MLVQESSMQGVQSASISSEVAPKCKICTLNCTLEEIALLNFLRELPKATQKEIESDNEDTAAWCRVSSLCVVCICCRRTAARWDYSSSSALGSSFMLWNTCCTSSSSSNLSRSLLRVSRCSGVTSLRSLGTRTNSLRTISKPFSSRYF